MRLNSWIDSFRERLAGHRVRRRPARHRAAAAELLEDRTLLSATTLWLEAQGLLVITATAGEQIVVGSTPTGAVEIEIDGQADESLPSIPTGFVQRLEIRGGDGNNIIDLTDVRAATFSFADSLGNRMAIDVDGGDGNDTISGSLDLDDTLDGGDGNDVINGGQGNNSLNGGDGNDRITGGQGDDILVGHDGRDTVLGQAGDDTIDGGNGNDSLLGHAGNDDITGGHGRDSLFGGDDQDTLSGGDGPDLLDGGNGDDSLMGGSQNDTLDGGLGNDTLLGQAGADFADGGDDDDLVVGGSGRDTLFGGKGNDKLNGQKDHDLLSGGIDDDTLFGGAGNDTLTGDDGDDTLRGQGGNDRLVDHAGDDLIAGDTGRDFIDARATFLTIDDVQIDVEGDTGEVTPTVFTVTRIGSTDSVLAVDYATLDATATAGADYTPVTDTLVFGTGVVSQTITVNVLGDDIAEAVETFLVKLTNPVGAVLYDDTGEGRIIDDDPMIAVGQPVNVTKALDYQGEVTIAVNPTDPNNIIVAPIDDASLLSSPNRDTVWVTTDGGINWSMKVIPNPSGQDYAAGDPTITFNRLGDAVYGHMTFTMFDQFGNPSPLNLASAVSTDKGQNWTAGVITSGDNNDDKLWVTAGPDVNNLSQDIYYVTFHRLNTIYVSRSTDGVNWSSIVAVSDFGGKIDSTPAVDSNGTLTICWLDFNTSGESPIECDISGDGGQTWGTDRTAWITNVNAFNDPFNNGGVYLLPVQPDRKFLPTISLEYDLSSSSTEGRLYLAFVDQGDLDGDADANNATDHHDLDVFVIISDDNGDTWSAPTRVNDDTGVNSQIHSWLSVDPQSGKVGVVWQDARNDNGGGGAGDTNGVANDDVQIYASISVNGGQTWLANEQITAAASNGRQADSAFNYGEYIGSDFYDNTFYMTWTDNSNSTGDNPDGALSSPESYFNTITFTEVGDPPPPYPNPSFNVLGSDTLLGGNGNDTIFGGLTDDLIKGGLAKDLIDGGHGNDTIYGNGGRDTITGGGGDDTIHGNEGNDKLTGGDGNDSLFWETTDANDTPSGGAGFDRLIVNGKATADTISITQTSGGGAKLQIYNGTYRITVGTRLEQIVIDTGDGDDAITVSNLHGVPGVLLLINGQDGNDTIDATDARMGSVRLLLDGGDGNDQLIGSRGDDTIRGGDGNDTVLAGLGHDVVDAGDGDDSITGDDGDDTISGEEGNDTIIGNPGDDLLDGGDGDDSLTGGNDDDTLIGGLGDDKLNGQRGNDSLSGDNGADTLTGGSGDDTLDGGLGDDRLLGNDGNDRLRGGDGNDELRGHDGDDVMNGGDGDDTLIGSAGNDGLAGGDGDDHLNAGGGNDTVVGGDGHDTLLGGSGNDIALGEDGNDKINGQGSSDTIAGGEGFDYLVGMVSEIDEAFQLPSTVMAWLEA